MPNRTAKEEPLRGLLFLVADGSRQPPRSPARWDECRARFLHFPAKGENEEKTSCYYPAASPVSSCCYQTGVRPVYGDQGDLSMCATLMPSRTSVVATRSLTAVVPHAIARNVPVTDGARTLITCISGTERRMPPD